jgi:hypothetical protein
MKNVLCSLLVVVAIMFSGGMAIAAEDVQKKCSTENILLCSKCGHIKGTEVCCKADAQKCDKCGLAKGSPGCCKLPKMK